jgi:predicted Zn-dependent protease
MAALSFWAAYCHAGAACRITGVTGADSNSRPPANSHETSQVECFCSWGRASEATRPARNRLSGRPQQLFREATDLFASGQFSEAVPLLREATKLAPDEPTLCHYLGYALWKENRWKEAGQEFEKALHLDPKNVYALYFLERTL